MTELGREESAAGWAYATYINQDTEFLNAKATERGLEYFSSAVEAAKAYERQQLSPRDCAHDGAAEARRRSARAEGSREARRARRHHVEDGRHVRRGEVLPEGTGVLQGPDAAGRRPRQQPQLRRADRSVDRLAFDGASAAQGLRALRRAGERRRARAGLRGSRRDVALRLRHAAGRFHEGSRATVGAGEAAVRRAALLRARQAAENLRRGARARRQADSRAAARQHVGAAVGRDLSAGRAVSGRQRPRRHRGAREAEVRRRAHHAIGRETSTSSLGFPKLPQTFWERSMLDAAARSRRAVSRQRLAHGRQGRRAHQACASSRRRKT